MKLIWILPVLVCLAWLLYAAWKQTKKHPSGQKPAIHKRASAASMPVSKTPVLLDSTNPEDAASPFTLHFHFTNRRESDLEEINKTLSQYTLSSLKIKERRGYIARETTTNTVTGKKTTRFWYGLDDCVLYCTPATSDEGFRYQISTMVMDKTETDCDACWRKKNPGRAMRTSILIELEQHYVIIVLHHRKKGTIL